MIKIYINLYRLIFPLLGILLSKDRNIIEEDIKVWVSNYNIKKTSFSFQVYILLLRFREFRNVIYYRLQNDKKVCILRFISKILLPELNSLYITTPKIGKGFFIMHGFSTIISAESIGDYFTCFQQVTIGYNGNYTCKIKNNVTVYCGAKVLGGIVVNNNVSIGANTVVIKDIPENSTAVGVPAKIIKKGKI